MLQASLALNHVEISYFALTCLFVTAEILFNLAEVGFLFSQ